MPAKERMESLKERKAKIEQQIATLEARARAQDRKEDTRLKVLLGAAVLSDSKIRPKTAALVQEILQRAITAERDREFLERKGWLKTATIDKPEP